MSIVTLKKKSAVVNSKNHSGRGGSINWVGDRDTPFVHANSGFSLNGPLRNVGYVGKTYGFSKVFTPFKGELPVGSGGCCGGYNNSNIVYSVSESDYETNARQGMYNKSSVLSTGGMLRMKYKWAYSGTYPNRWVQPDSNNSDYATQGSYVSTKSAKNNCVVDTNDLDKYVDHVNNSERVSGISNRLDCANNYTKSLHIPVDSSIYTGRIQQKCKNPTDEQKPFPYAVNGNGCNMFVSRL